MAPLYRLTVTFDSRPGLSIRDEEELAEEAFERIETVALDVGTKWEVHVEVEES